MDLTQEFDLSGYPRLFHYPYRLANIGWMPHHLYYHQNRVISGCFVCLVSNSEGPAEILINGERHLRFDTHGPILLVFLPGTRYSTIQASYHDELFFRYDDHEVEALWEFLGKDPALLSGIELSGFPEALIGEIRNSLLNLSEPGEADRLDQLAIRLLSEVLVHCRNRPATESANRLKLHALAAELLKGRSLKVLLDQYGFSSRSFYREWKQVFPVSPNVWKLEHMLNSACALLEGSAFTPEEIADRCGFASTVYFYQCFHRKMGVSPGEYRRTSRGRLFER